MENGQLGIYDLAINAFGSSVGAAARPDQEFTTVKINEGRSLGFWQLANHRKLQNKHETPKGKNTINIKSS